MDNDNDDDRPKCNGYVCAYSCIEEFANVIKQSRIRQFVMSYDYEMHVTDKTMIEDAIYEVEERFLSILSSYIGLDGCDPVKRENQFQFGQNYTWIHNNIPITSEEAAIASVGSAPLDQVDDTKDECSMGGADNLENLTCFPIHGELTVGYYGNETVEIGISKSIENLIKRGATDDWFLTDEIKKIVYRENEEQPLETEFLSSNNGDNISLSNAAISTIVAVTASVIIGVALLAKKMRKKRNRGIFVLTPSPQAGKKSGLRAHDSESVRSDLNLKSFDAAAERIDPFETDSQIGEQSFVSSESSNSVLQNPTPLFNIFSHLSTITEGSKETSSNGNRLSIMSSPMVRENFNLILSDSTYSDGAHSLSRSVDTSIENARYIEDLHNTSLREI